MSESSGGVVRIPVRHKGEIVAYAIVDLEDARQARHRWYLHEKGYAIRTVWLGDGRQRMARLHREIMGLTKADRIQVDHVNRDKLDCRRGNMRLATNAQNHQNLNSNRGSTSRFRGVYWVARRRRWVARVVLEGRGHYLGSFLLEEDAARVARAFRLAHMPFTVE